MGEYGTIAKDQNMEEQLHTVVTANLRSCFAPSMSIREGILKPRWVWLVKKR